MAKFILNRPDDYLSLSKKKILGTWIIENSLCFHLYVNGN